MSLRLLSPFHKTTPQPDVVQSVVWTAWHTAGMVLTLTDLGIGTTLFILHYTIATILALLSGVQAVALGMIGGLYQVALKKVAP